jgi:hypothetical protein
VIKRGLIDVTLLYDILFESREQIFKRLKWQLVLNNGLTKRDEDRVKRWV